MTSKLKSILKDESGNALVIFAACLVPVTMMIGSGLDISVTYMAQAKLQNACDAGVLAGRQSMEGNRWDAAAEAEARRFFNFNFPSGSHGVTSPNFTVNQDTNDAAQIVGTASGTVPTSIMRIFGYNTIAISAECNAKRDLGHNDVMLVLDTTGSMNDAPSNGPGTKIQRLRNGAAGLYRALDDAANGSVTRFGMVSYSHTVNVGGSLNNSDILDDQEYNDRYRNCWRDWRGRRRCSSWMNRSKTVSAANSSWGSKSDFRNSGWACIEERPSDGETRSPFEINDTVSLADINNRSTGSSDTLLQFGRYDPSIQEGESQSGCPSPSRRLAVYNSEADFTAAVNATTANVTGGTYHDVGMLWGTRFISRNGFFAAQNPTDISGVPVNQHIVFMTDGMIDTGGRLYSAHGIEDYQGRTQGPGNRTQDHLARFEATCDVAKSMGITIWVIALDVTSTGDIEPCATSEAHFYTSDGSDLEEVFEQIGQGIGNLRLTK